MLGRKSPRKTWFLGQTFGPHLDHITVGGGQYAAGGSVNAEWNRVFRCAWFVTAWDKCGIVFACQGLWDWFLSGADGCGWVSWQRTAHSAGSIRNRWRCYST